MEQTTATRRILVVASEEVVNDEILDKLREHLGSAEADVLVVAPAAPDTRLKDALGDVDEALAAARERLETWSERLRREGMTVRAAVGDPNPVQAIDDALAQFPADEIVIFTRTSEEAGWGERDLFDRARLTFEPPITRIVVDPSDGHVVAESESGPGVDPPDDAEVDPPYTGSRTLTVRDVAGIVVAIVGTVALVVLAAQCSGAEVQRD